MATIEQLQSQLTALKEMRASGVLSVQHGDTRLQYRSMDELMLAIREVTKELNKLSGKTRKPRYVRQTGKGL